MEMDVDRLEVLEQRVARMEMELELAKDGTVVPPAEVPHIPQLIGGSSGAGPFEPIFEDGKLAAVGFGLFPFGRQFYDVASVDSSAKVETGLIGIEIEHDYPQSAKVVMISANKGSVVNSSLTKTRIPLYFIKDGEIEIDLRPAMSLAIRE